MQLSIQGHSQVHTVFSKGFYNSVQCGSGTYIITLFFEKWKFLQAVDEKQDIRVSLGKDGGTERSMNLCNIHIYPVVLFTTKSLRMYQKQSQTV